MFDAFCLGVALTVGQGSPTELPTVTVPPAKTVVAGEPRRMPAAAESELPPAKPGMITVYPVSQAEPKKAAEPKAPTEMKKDGAAAEEKKEEEPEEDTRGFFMKVLDGTPHGECLADKNISISGWLAGSYTKSHADGPSNLPLTWNDRANRFLFHQAWLKINQALDTESACTSYGFNIDLFYGSDYRYTLQRGFLNSQLTNSRGGQNINGFDMPQAYVNAYFPDVFNGTEVRVGKFYTPFGYESIEAPTTPLLSRSYSFNNAPPFTHWGVMAIVNLDDNYQATGAVVNGNDVMFLDSAEEYRILAKFAYTSNDKKTTWAVGTSLGRGRFDASDRFAPATGALPNEPAGRNNINVFDFTFSTEVAEGLTYATELIYGYQTGVPANVPGGIIDTTKAVGQTGTAHWGGLVKYLLYNFNDCLTGVARGEVFYDCEGQRTGFEGPYYAGTLGLRYSPYDCVLIRPEIRYDFNGNSRPFDGGTRHGLGTAAVDVILKY